MNRKEYLKQWCIDNREKRNLISNNWAKRNKEYRREYAKKWRKTANGVLKHKADRQKRRAMNSGLTRKDVQFVYERNINKYKTLTCELCFKNILFGDDSLEHFIPLSRGGTNAVENLGIAHISCNCKKGKKTIEEYNLWLGYKNDTFRKNQAGL